MADTALIERLLAEAEAQPDPAAREAAVGLAAALMELYGEGLERVVAVVAEHDPEGALAGALCADELVAHLLLLHGLHPEPLPRRVERALDDVRPYLASHGGAVELLGIEGAIVRVRLDGSCDGCPSSSATLQLAIEDAVQRAAPEIERVEADGAGAPEAPPLLQLEVMPAVRERRAWTAIAGLPDAPDGERSLEAIGDEEVLFLRLDGRWLAYRSACPACGESLARADLDGCALRCGACGHRYDARRAGRGLDGEPRLHLDPVPVLPAEGGGLKVAVGAPV